MRNRLYNCKNPWQGESKKVLCVCSAGLLRSPTIAWVLSNNPWNYNTRACGIYDYALVMIDDVLLTWADEIVTVEDEHEHFIKERLNKLNLSTKVINLQLPDNFGFRDKELITLIKEKYA